MSNSTPNAREFLLGESVRTDIVVVAQEEGLHYLYTLGPGRMIAHALHAYRESLIAPFVKLAKTLELRGSEHMELLDAIAKARGE